jgi:hypothetical protein
LGDPLKGNLLLFYKPLHLEAQQVSTRIEVRRHQEAALNKQGDKDTREATNLPQISKGTTELFKVKTTQTRSTMMTKDTFHPRDTSYQ